MLCNVKISEYEVYWLMDFPLINIWVHQKINSGNHSFFWCSMHYKKNNQVQGKISKFTLNRDHSYKKSKEIRVITYTYCSGHIIPVILSDMNEL